jgi:hypothetical protein
MMAAENGQGMAEMAVAGPMGPKVGKSFSDYVVDIGCWIIDAFFKTITFIVSGAIVMVGSAVIFVIELIVKIVLGAAMLWLSCWVFLWLVKICWMIWGPKNF